MPTFDTLKKLLQKGYSVDQSKDFENDPNYSLNNELPYDLSKENPIEVIEGGLDAVDKVVARPVRNATSALLSGENPIKAAFSDKNTEGKEIANKLLSKFEGAGATLRSPGMEEYPLEKPLGLVADLGLDVTNLAGAAPVKASTAALAALSALSKVDKAEDAAKILKIIPKDVVLNPKHGEMIAHVYDLMKHDPHNPKVKAAYEALIKETGQQFEDMVNSGFEFSKIKPGQKNPYSSSKDVHEDLKKNKHLWFFPTDQGFGTDLTSFKEHPLLSLTKYEHEGKPLSANDLFRIVHDYRGHHLGGETSFGPKGEHQAYLKHKEDFSPLAQQALTTETLGQNSWVNYGPFGESNRKNPMSTVYADQKAGLLPEEIIQGNWHSPKETEEDIIRFNKIIELLKNK